MSCKQVLDMFDDQRQQDGAAFGRTEQLAVHDVVQRRHLLVVEPADWHARDDFGQALAVNNTNTCSLFKDQ